MEKEFECPGRGKIQCSSCLELANIAFGYTFAKNRTPTQAEILKQNRHKTIFAHAFKQPELLACHVQPADGSL